MAGVDLNRGCTIRIHPHGFRVIMYKDAPGKYLSEAGDPLSSKLAGEAGFDVETLERERRKQERMAEYQAKVEAEFATEQENIETLLSAPTEGLHVKHIGKGKYAILDGEGERLTKNPLTKGEAEVLIKDLQSGGSDHGTSA